MGRITNSVLQQLKDGKMDFIDAEDGFEKPIDGTEFPNFFYSTPYDPVDPLEGLLKGPMLVRAYIAVFIGPSATYNEATNTITPRTSRGMAAKNSMYHVTPGSIAHIASQVYYSLLVNTDFSKSAVVEIGQIYDTVYAVFEGKEPVMQEYVKELLQWWDNIIFPVSVTSTTVKGSSIARLKKHLKLMKENRADAA
ncbi:hypothetical protein EW145_g8544 [Phellinidium pouzarii]|uniref:Uncharacterized protein n=1 Tax=Phellinidium pouzarii TaxID=167371 RepID=A0A4S4K576_9AGAM|nr:hypothetical protein EW145_g8544 [Phellinidium pouzarii]